MGASREAPGAPNASRSEKTLNWTFSPSPSRGSIFGTFREELWKRFICFFFIFWGRHLDGISLISTSFLGLFFQDSLGLWVNLGNSDFAIRSMWNHRFQGSVGSVFCVFWHTFLGLLPGACFLLFWVFFGVTFGSLLVPTVALVAVLEASKKWWKKGLGQFWERGAGL